MRRLTFALALILVLDSISVADIAYRVQVMPSEKRISVTMSFSVKPGTTEVQLPNWAPGAYILRNVSGRIKDLRAFYPGSGLTVDVSEKAPNTWDLTATKSGLVTASYWLDATANDERLHFSGPSTYLYVVGRKDEKCTVGFDLPNGWTPYLGLDQSSNGIFTAPTYDVLADNPVSVGKFVTDTYTSHGAVHTMVYHTGDPSKLDRAKAIKMCKFVSDSEGDFFGEMPYKKYIWHFSVIDAPGGGGGLEHLNSTEIGLATGLSESTQSLLAHEYFHAWNVKRIRSSVLGPFDYTQLPKTGALWWLEGVTDYYASLLPMRYGMLGESFFFREIVKNVQTTRAAAARMDVSPYDSSFRVGDANNGRGNSSGYGVDYYNTGWLLGLCLDIELRSRTAGKKSLDDVEMSLWKRCRNNQSGFPEDGIRKALVSVGGPGMGEVYDTWVMQPGELPIEAQLAKMGLEMKSGVQEFTDTGFDASPGQTGVRVRRVRGATGLNPGDVITQINDTDFQGMSGSNLAAAYRKLIDSAKPGDKFAVKYKRGEAEGTTDVTVTKGSRDVFEVSSMSNVSPEVLKLRVGWYHAGKKPTVQP